MYGSTDIARLRTRIWPGPGSGSVAFTRAKSTSVGSPAGRATRWISRAVTDIDQPPRAFVGRCSGAVLQPSVPPGRRRRRPGSRPRTGTGRESPREPRSAERVLPGQRLADDELVHLTGALIGQHGLQVVRVPQHRILPGDAVGAED